jgi:phage gpG-like protein
MAKPRIRLALQDLAAELEKPIDYGPLMKIFGEMLRSNAAECFEQAREPEGGAWKALKRPRPGSKGGDIPLNDTGILRESINAVGTKGNINVVEPRRVEVGTNLDYSTIHQWGGTITPKQAKFLAIPATVEAKNKGSPRNWAPGELDFRFGAKGGVAVKKTIGPYSNVVETIQYYFAKSVTIPARPYLGISDAQADEFAEEAADYVADKVVEKVADAGGV